MGNGEVTFPQSKANLGPIILNVDWVLFTLSTTIVILRLGTRVWITRNPGWDDAAIALAQSFNAVGKALTIKEVDYGLGQHKQAISPGKYTKYLKYDYLDWGQTFITLCLAKISVCLFLLRLSSFSKLRNVLRGLILFIAITHVSLLLMFLLQCNPVSKYWNTQVGGSCFSKRSVMRIIIAQGVFSILVDFVCAAFPIVLLRKAKINTKVKVGLCLLMGLGFITAVACIVRTAFSHEIMSQDVSWVGVPNALARIIEVNLGHIAACMPLMKPLTRYIQAWILGRDSYGLRHPSNSGTGHHSHWYFHIWTPRAHRNKTSTKYQRDWFPRAKIEPPNNESQLTKQPYNVGARLPPVKDEIPPSVSLDLPLQGSSEEDEAGGWDSSHHATKSEKGPRDGPERRWVPYDSV